MNSMDELRPIVNGGYCLPPKQKRAKKTVGVQRFSNDASKLETSESEQPTSSSSLGLSAAEMKAKQAQEKVWVRTFSNDASKLGTSDLEQPTSSSSFLNVTHLANGEHQIIPQDSHERANKCSTVQTGSGCEAQITLLFDGSITEFLNGNGLIKARIVFPVPFPKEEFTKC